MKPFNSSKPIGRRLLSAALFTFAAQSLSAQQSTTAPDSQINVAPLPASNDETVLPITTLGSAELSVPASDASSSIGATAEASIASQNPPAPLPEPEALPPVNANEMAEEDREELLRGPVHEAYAEQLNADPVPGLVVVEKPPEAVEEIPPELKPDGRQVEWISGYWAWDEDQDDFIWVSGIWREVPQGFRWLPGYWTEVEGGFQWVSGTWVSTQTEEINYIEQAPPETLEQGPVGIAPTESHIWVPGNWTWTETRYAWRPGYWSTGYANWCWVPARYQWTPRGYYHCDGYWDYPVDRRGVLFAPSCFDRRFRNRRISAFTPRIVVSTNLLTSHFWVRPQYRHYYFGNYYDVGYSNRGLLPWHQFPQQRRCFDPLYAYYGRGRRSNDFYDQLNVQFNVFVNQPNRRPALTFRDQDRWQRDRHDDFRPDDFLGNRFENIVDRASRDRNGFQFVRMENLQREQVQQEARRLRELMDQRRDVERSLAQLERQRKEEHDREHGQNGRGPDEASEKPPGDNGSDSRDDRKVGDIVDLKDQLKNDSDKDRKGRDREKIDGSNDAKNSTEPNELTDENGRDRKNGDQGETVRDEKGKAGESVANTDKTGKDVAQDAGRDNGQVDDAIAKDPGNDRVDNDDATKGPENDKNRPNRDAAKEDVTSDNQGLGESADQQKKDRNSIRIEEKQSETPIVIDANDPTKDRENRNGRDRLKLDPVKPDSGETKPSQEPIKDSVDNVRDQVNERPGRLEKDVQGEVNRTVDNGKSAPDTDAAKGNDRAADQPKLNLRNADDVKEKVRDRVSRIRDPKEQENKAAADNSRPDSGAVSTPGGESSGGRKIERSVGRERLKLPPTSKSENSPKVTPNRSQETVTPDSSLKLGSPVTDSERTGAARNRDPKPVTDNAANRARVIERSGSNPVPGNSVKENGAVELPKSESGSSRPSREVRSSAPPKSSRVESDDRSSRSRIGSNPPRATEKPAARSESREPTIRSTPQAKERSSSPPVNAAPPSTGAPGSRRDPVIKQEPASSAAARSRDNEPRANTRSSSGDSGAAARSSRESTPAREPRSTPSMSSPRGDSGSGRAASSPPAEKSRGDSGAARESGGGRRNREKP